MPRSTSTSSSRSASAPRPLPEPQATALIAAAGSGERLGAGGPKALLTLAGRPMLAWCLEAFAAATTVGAAVIAAPPGREQEVAELAPPGLAVTVVPGGASRSESVAAALAAAGEPGLVAVHDAARPLVTGALIDSLVALVDASPGAAGAIAAAPVTDTIKRVEAGSRRVTETVDRSLLWAAQTPQVFRASALQEALAADPATIASASDDASLVEAAGGEILIGPGPASNLKVTTPTDLALAELLLAER